MLLIFLSLLLLSVTNGLPLAKKHDSSLMSEIMSSKDDQESLMSILVNADPAKLNEVIVIVEAIIQSSQAELAGLTADSDNADAAYESAVTAHNDSLTAQTTGENQLATALASAQAAAQSVYDISNSEALATYNQWKAVLQSNVDTAEAAKQSASLAKSTANGILAAERSRLESEIATLGQVISLIRGVIGINTFAPTASPTASKQCIDIVTGSIGSGALNVDAYQGGFWISVVSGSSLYGNNAVVVSNQCYVGITALRVRNPTINAWSGTIRLDGEVLTCTGCTGTELASTIVVDGDSDGYNQSPTDCLNGASCILHSSTSPLNCIDIVTGVETSNAGTLDVDAKQRGNWIHIVSGNFYDLGDVVVNGECHEGITALRVRNPTIDGWAGTIRLDGELLTCSGCTGTALASTIVVDGDGDGSSLSPTACLNGASCILQ